MLVSEENEDDLGKRAVSQMYKTVLVDEAHPKLRRSLQ